MSRLNNGQPFPPLDVPAVGGGTIGLSGDRASYGVILIYRACLYPLGPSSRLDGVRSAPHHDGCLFDNQLARQLQITFNPSFALPIQSGGNESCPIARPN